MSRKGVSVILTTVHSIPTGKNRHHRKPKIKGGKGDRRNIILVDAFKHWCFHKLFGTLSPEEIAKELNDNWIPIEYKMIVQRRGK